MVPLILPIQRAARLRHRTEGSDIPCFVLRQGAIQFRAEQSPVRQVLTQQRLEAVVMTPLHEIQQFVRDHVFQATGRLFDQLQRRSPVKQLH